LSSALFRTEAYARAVLRAILPDLLPEEIEPPSFSRGEFEGRRPSTNEKPLD